MARDRKVLTVAGAALVLPLVIAISIPNLLRSRMSASDATLVAALRSAEMSQQEADKQGSPAPYEHVAISDKKMIYNAELGLMVSDVRAAVEQIRKLTELNHGDIDKLEITETGGGSLSASVVIRVPASGLQSVLAELTRLAVRTEREQNSARDVTREFYDNEAHMRNLRAEEQQYLAIMKQARTVKDTLEASGKLSDVRDRIERLQAQIQLMTHDIQMSVVTIALMQESDAQVFGIRWRPLYNAQIAMRELLAGLGEWLDWVVAVFIKLPLIILWVVTVGGILWIIWRIGRSAWLRFMKPTVAQKLQ